MSLDALLLPLQFAFMRDALLIAVLVAVPSLILLAWLQRRGHFAGLETEQNPA